MESEMADAPKPAPAAGVTAEPLAAVAEEGDAAEANESVGSTLTMERVAAAKKFIENHYRSQMKTLQERKERYRSDTPQAPILAAGPRRARFGLDLARCLLDRGAPTGWVWFELAMLELWPSCCYIGVLIFHFCWCSWNAGSGTCALVTISSLLTIFFKNS